MCILTVKSREIINTLFEQSRSFLLPILQGLNGGEMIQCALGDVVIIEPDVPKNRVFETLGGIEAMGRQDLADPAIEALDHAVGLWVPGLDEAMIDAIEGAGLVKRVCAPRLAFAPRTEAIGELLAIVSQDTRDGTFSITPGKGQCAAARSRMREGRGGILFIADTRSRRNSQKDTPSLRQVFLRLAKVSRQRRPRSLRVPPLTFRFLT